MTEADALAEKARTEEALRSWAKAKKLPEVLQEFYGLVLQLPHGADRRLLSVLEAAIPWVKETVNGASFNSYSFSMKAPNG